ncbi:MAG: superoxide dismutase family protein [Hyphomicrobiaceae bacterium]|nr:superoxide dismutase family protein [Hyphomicrobiaceae bacterium]
MALKPLALATALLAVSSATAFAATAASVQLKDKDGKPVGNVALRQTTSQGVWMNLVIDNLPAGPHAFHVHETGKCEGEFKSAGGHFNPAGMKHGVLVEGGPHAGDLPNIHVPDSGRLTVEFFAPHITLERGAKNSVFDEDGSALVIHAGVDDYKSQPAGEAGGRIACGVVSGEITGAPSNTK